MYQVDREMPFPADLCFSRESFHMAWKVVVPGPRQKRLKGLPLTIVACRATYNVGFCGTNER